MRTPVTLLLFLLVWATSTVNAQITNAPSFSTNPINLTTCEFNTATFDVVALDYDSLRWQIFSNSAWSDLADTGSVSGSSTPTLVISNLSLAYNASQFRCVAFGPIAPNAISTTATLTVLKVPAITSFTPSRTICENDDCNFNVQSPGGGGLFTYQWQVDSGFGFVNVVNNFNYTGATTKTMNIASCPANMNMFYYRCIVSGPCNSSDTSTAVFLKVNTYPTISTQPTSKTICEGSSTTLSVGSSGSSLNHQWLQEVNGVFVNVTGSAVFSAGGTNTLNISNPPISLNNTRFICRISNTCGSPIFTDTVTLFIKTIPTAPVFSSFNLTPCQGQPNDYTITPVTFADNYLWSVSLTGTTLSASDTTATLNFNTSVGSTTLSVLASNICGSSATTSLTINPNPSYQFVQSFSSCANDSILLNGIYFFADTTIINNLSTTNGCDSTITTNLTFSPAYDIQIDLGICGGDSIFINGAWQSNSGTFTESYTTTNGCDSTITTNLTFLPSYAIQNDLSICGGDSIFINGAWQFNSGTFTESYTTTNGCDSTITTNLTVYLGYYTFTMQSICQGDSLLFNGNYYSTTGSYVFPYTSSLGCDSVIALDLTVNVLPTVSLSLDTTLCENGSPLDLTNYVSPIGGTFTGLGVTGNNFDPASSSAGSFAINYTYTDLNGCIGSSVDSITVDICSGLNDNETLNLTLYPNPASNILHLNGLQNQSLVSIYDVTGKMVLQVEVDKNSNNSINIASLNPGFYQCRIIQNNESTELQFIKK